MSGACREPGDVPDPSTMRSGEVASHRCRLHQQQRVDRVETRRLDCSRYMLPRVAVTRTTHSTRTL